MCTSIILVLYFILDMFRANLLKNKLSRVGWLHKLCVRMRRLCGGRMRRLCGGVMDQMKIRLTQSSLVELGLGLSLAITASNPSWH